MSVGILLLLGYWTIFTARRYFTPKVTAAIKAEKYDLNRAAANPEKERHARRLACWNAAKRALHIAGWAETALVVLALVWVVYLTGRFVLLGYPIY